MEESVSAIAWMDVLETGVPEIDDDHRLLIEQCNTLGRLLNGGAWSEVVDAARRLAESCSEHFRMEEALLVRTAFPRAERHKLAHREIERRFAELVRLLSASDGSNPGDRKTARNVRATLVDLLFRHDLDFKSHLEHIAGR